ncbi:MAG: glycogen/starch/alpha-glucan phosphorylase [Candidatus Omnitrophota bacterium]|nr:glycogen/starch/alpha-glucan phosphorylase [Candidatus Omnitrophota bacterium]
MTRTGLRKSFTYNLCFDRAKDRYTTTSHDAFMAMALAVRDRIVERWIQTQQTYHKENRKRVYYLSMEFLIGRLLGNNLINLDLWDKAREAVKAFDLDIEEICNEELDAGLGNGGLGRLAACFLDSMATLGIPAHGYGIRYDYGIFKQRIVNGYQVEFPDEWLKSGNPWEFARPEYAVTVRFYGNTRIAHDKGGRLIAEWENTQDVIAMPYDVPVPGYQNDTVNTLRLWSARSSEEFDLEYFNDGDYEKAVYKKMFSENISKVLYPNDSSSAGRELRLKQEYFFTAASVADIIRRFKSENEDLKNIPDKVAIQLNDTHPALAVAEFMRILIDDEALDWDTAWDLTVRTFAYTNHTVMPEALECWSVHVFERLLPRHMQIIYEINARFLREVANQFPGDTDRLRRMSIIAEGEPKQIRMGYLAIIGSHSVNGVSALHSLLITQGFFSDFHTFAPEKFNNKTNGITHRRWLLKANPALSRLISDAIGKRWIKDLDDIKRLEPYHKDAAFREKWMKVKKQNKRVLAGLIREMTGVRVDEHSLFDVQVKRIHEYKRQVLFAFYIISEYLKIKHNPRSHNVSRTFIFGGKAAPGYAMAKLVIKFITSIAGVINQDRSCHEKLKVLFLENYRVSLAEKIFPASDLSEQISTAGKEASGTGCMKFMMNGALTIGTQDGANIEMAEAAGSENMFMFGLSSEEVKGMSAAGYNPREIIQKSPVLEEIFQMVEADFFSPMEQGIFRPLIENLKSFDRYFVCADFEAYCQAQAAVSKNYLDVQDWTQKAILNVSRSGKFSSDRTIAEYAQDIWGLECGEFKKQGGNRKP